jgi:hypothetical protein
VFHPILRGFLGKIRIRTNIFMGVKWTLCYFWEEGEKKILEEGKDYCMGF